MLSAEKIMEQADTTAAYWMRAAIEEIDSALGEGYAKEHPELIGQYMIAAALDQHAMYVRALVEERGT
jgi:hypothetical protein